MNNSMAYLVYIFSRVRLALPIFMLLYQDKGLDIQTVTLCFSVSFLISVIVGIPSGFIAAKLGNKTTLLFMVLVDLLCIAGVSLSSNVWVMYLCIALDGVAFEIGLRASNLMVYAVASQNLEVDFAKINGRLIAVTSVFSLLLNMGAGYLYKINMALPFVINAVMLGLCLLTLLFYKDIEKHSEHNTAKTKSLREYLKGYLVHVKNVKQIWTIIWFNVVASLFMRYIGLINKDYYVNIGLTVEQIGLAASLFTIVQIVSSFYSHKLIEWTRGATFSIVFQTAVIILIGIFLVNNPWGIVFVLLMSILGVINEVATNKYLNFHCNDEFRNFSSSILVTIKNLIWAICLPITGFFIDKLGISTLSIYVAILLLLIMNVMSLMMNRTLNKQGTQNGGN